MHYKTLQDLPSKVKHSLSEDKQEKFLNTFNSVADTYGDRAFEIAWKMANTELKVAKATVSNPREYVGKSALAHNHTYMADFVFGDMTTDADGDNIPKDSFLKKINGMIGDIEHCNNFPSEANKEFDKNPLFTVKDSFFNGDQMVGTVEFNDSHKQFEGVWNKVQKGEFGISLEYVKSNDNYDIIGITGALKQKNKTSKVLSYYVL